MLDSPCQVALQDLPLRPNTLSQVGSRDTLHDTSDLHAIGHAASVEAGRICCLTGSWQPASQIPAV